MTLSMKEDASNNIIDYVTASAPLQTSELKKDMDFINPQSINNEDHSDSPSSSKKSLDLLLSADKNENILANLNRNESETNLDVRIVGRK